jgi:hypothetical protein
MQNRTVILSAYFKDQWQKWPELAALHRSLTSDKAIKFEVNNHPFWVYTLAHRKNSAIGGYRKISAGSPLEPKHLLPKQSYYPLLEGFHFMVNPYPIFDEHGIVCSAQLRPQKVYGHLHEMLSIQEKVGLNYCVLYNGIGSGASIPEHWHIHLLPKSLFSYWEAYADLNSDSSAFHFFDDGLRRGVHLHVKDHSSEKIQESIDSLTHFMSKVLNFEESLINVFLFKRDTSTTEIIIFLRKAHRHRYFPEAVEDAGILISPGVVDVLGHIVCSREDDLKTLTSLALEHIFEDIFIDRATFQHYTTLLKRQSAKSP